MLKNALLKDNYSRYYLKFFLVPEESITFEELISVARTSKVIIS